MCSRCILPSTSNVQLAVKCMICLIMASLLKPIGLSVNMDALKHLGGFHGDFMLGGNVKAQIFSFKYHYIHMAGCVLTLHFYLA